MDPFSSHPLQHVFLVKFLMVNGIVSIISPLFVLRCALCAQHGVSGPAAALGATGLQNLHRIRLLNQGCVDCPVKNILQGDSIQVRPLDSAGLLCVSSRRHAWQLASLEGGSQGGPGPRPDSVSRPPSTPLYCPCPSRGTSP